MELARPIGYSRLTPVGGDLKLRAGASVHIIGKTHMTLRGHMETIGTGGESGIPGGGPALSPLPPIPQTTIVRI